MVFLMLKKFGKHHHSTSISVSSRREGTGRVGGGWCLFQILADKRGTYSRIYGINVNAVFHVSHALLVLQHSFL